jgi:hypothetical protein
MVARFVSAIVLVVSGSLVATLAGSGVQLGGARSGSVALPAYCSRVNAVAHELSVFPEESPAVRSKTAARLSSLSRKASRVSPRSLRSALTTLAKGLDLYPNIDQATQASITAAARTVIAHDDKRCRGKTSPPT